MSLDRGAKLYFGITIAALLVVGAAATLFAEALFNTPDFGKMRTQVEIPIKLASGEKSTRLIGPAAAGWVPLSQISNHLLMAVIASEDTSFFSHEGVDFHEIREAVKKDLKEKRWARGASTITQQVVKNVFLTPEKSLVRKIKEVIWARRLDKALSKSEILCFYANMVEWGPGIYGVGAASRYYFGTSASELTPKQSAFLAMLLPAPVRYHAYFKKRELTEWATKRVNQILRVMNRMGFIDEVTHDEAVRESLWGETPKVFDSDALPSGTEDREVPETAAPIAPRSSDEKEPAPANTPPRLEGEPAPAIEPLIAPPEIPIVSPNAEEEPTD